MFRRMPRSFSGFALWIVLGVAVALIPVACGSSSPGPDSGDGPHQMTNPG